MLADDFTTAINCVKLSCGPKRTDPKLNQGLRCSKSLQKKMKGVLFSLSGTSIVLQGSFEELIFLSKST